MIQKSICGKQYIDETKRRLKDRFKTYFKLLWSYSHACVVVSEHYLSNNHSYKDMLLISLEVELLKSKCNSIRKAREAHLIQKAA